MRRYSIPCTAPTSFWHSRRRLLKNRFQILFVQKVQSQFVPCLSDVFLSLLENFRRLQPGGTHHITAIPPVVHDNSRQSCRAFSRFLLLRKPSPWASRAARPAFSIPFSWRPTPVTSSAWSDSITQAVSIYI